jgi:hypothetical protein
MLTTSEIGRLLALYESESHIAGVPQHLIPERSNKTVEALEELIAWREAAGNKPPLALRFDKEGRVETVLPYGKSVVTLQNLKPPKEEIRIEVTRHGDFPCCGKNNSEPEHSRPTREYCPCCGTKTSSSGSPPRGGLNYDYVIPGPHPLGCPTYLQRWP